VFGQLDAPRQAHEERSPERLRLQPHLLADRGLSDARLLRRAREARKPLGRREGAQRGELRQREGTFGTLRRASPYMICDHA
jgi:hypothetical protein